ncbi:Repetin [Streptomyces sp. BA2]|uniref:Repetin n=1 Tax=Streptomyces sp. BA2 TaxID=436595 RepID=UPI001320F041|nr:Repetin [Streptomyces sp. BA2]MWA09798.1 Repetin [Streptomyces sp. BA2]
MNRRSTLIRVVAAGAVLLALAGAVGPATASDAAPRPGREAAALTGTAKLDRPAGDEATITFDAHLDAAGQNDPRTAYGTIKFSHYMENPEFGGSAEARVDCLLTGGKVATVSAVVTKADGGLKGAIGKRVGMTVHDQGKQDRFGYSWAMVGIPNDLPDDMPKCVSAAPFDKTAPGSGDLRVRPMERRP